MRTPRALNRRPLTDIAGLIREPFLLLPVYALVFSGGEFCSLRFALKKLFSGAQRPFAVSHQRKEGIHESHRHHGNANRIGFCRFRVLIR